MKLLYLTCDLVLEDEDFEPDAPKATTADQWSGEDEDDDVKVSHHH